MMRRWPLRRRLGVAVGIVILAVGATISTVVFLSVERVLVDRIDDDLRSVAIRPEFRGPIQPSQPVEAPPPASAESDPDFDTETNFRPVAVVEFDQNGTVVVVFPSGYADEPEPVPDLSALTVDDLERRTDTLFDLNDIEGGDLRGLLRSTQTGGWTLFTQSLEDADGVLSRVLLVSVLATGIAAGVGVLGSWTVLRRGFRPIDDMIDTATAIAAGERDRRVEADEAETELGRLGTALDDMMDRLADADAEREAQSVRLRRFVDDASHELRTPVAAIVGYVELYEQGGVDKPDELERAMGRIGEAGRRAERLITDLLALARLDHEVSQRRDPVDLATVVEAIVAETKQVAGRDIRAEVDGPVVIEGDRIWLSQALANILRNAIAHAPPDEPIHVRLTSNERIAQLAVIDHGPGVDEAERARVFDRFARQDDGRDRDRGGAGLGLAIVREVVKGHSGEVELTETPGGGATVTMRLPMLPR